MNQKRKIDPVYRQRVEALGSKQGYRTIPCPYCSKLLWTKAQILQPDLEDEELKRIVQEFFK
jgi:DNA-directed RNA polymerase subunit RPC12/RpoP